MACQAPSDPRPSPSLPPPEATAEPGPSERVDAPWLVEGFWDDPGPLDGWLGSPIDMRDPGIRWAVRWAVSSDGKSWQAKPEPLMPHLTSLDLVETEQGLILNGLIAPGHGVVISPSKVYGIHTRDLVHWGSHTLNTPQPVRHMMVDPSLHVPQGGMPSLLFYRVDLPSPTTQNCTEQPGGCMGADPALAEGDHVIERLTWDGQKWTNPVQILAGPGLADPMICAIQGQEWLFTTRLLSYKSGTVQVAKGMGPDTFVVDESLSWSDHSVPSCRTDGDVIRIVAHNTRPELPFQHAIFDGQTLQDLGDFFDEWPWPGEACTSPVVGKLHDTWVMFCAAHPYNARKADTGPPGAPPPLPPAPPR